MNYKDFQPMPKKTIVYLYKRKYPIIENKLDNISDKFRCQVMQVTPSRAFAFGVSKVPALIVIDKTGEVRVRQQGLESINNYLDLIDDKKQS